MSDGKPILNETRAALEYRGFHMRVASRPCKLCGVFIEDWTTPGGKRIVLELHLERPEWKLRPHIYSCRGKERPPAPAAETQEKLF